MRCLYHVSSRSGSVIDQCGSDREQWADPFLISGGIFKNVTVRWCVCVIEYVLQYVTRSG